MGFKLGSQKGSYMVGGEIRKKLQFDKEGGDSDVSVPGTPVIRTDLDSSLGEANMDGSIYINDKIPPGSFAESQIINHEMRHATDMKIGKLTYADDHIQWNGEVFPRKTKNGKDMILVYGEWKEAGSHDFPWEHAANNGNQNGVV